jgi:cytochrome c peroxidase
MPRGRRRLIAALALAGLAGSGCGGKAAGGAERQPVRLRRPADLPLSPVAQLGRALFYDPILSASGALSCATCHSPSYAYGPPPGREIAPGGRAVPSLRYVDRVPSFSFGPRDAEAEEGAAFRTTAGQVPRGGLFWDGRANTLQDQARGPLFNPVEMGNRDVGSVARRLRRSSFGSSLARLFGAGTVKPAERLVDEALFAIARFQMEDPSFHPYSSKYDAYLEGRASLTVAEQRGLHVFEDPERGNCASCHLDRPDPEGRPPPFSDYEYEALGVPRNEALPANRDPDHYDLGLCGPARADLQSETALCGLFRTPSLRNVGMRRVFFHNGVYRELAQVLEFYAFRDSHPERVFPRGPDGRPERFDDLPAAARRNVDVADAPFGRAPGDPPPLSAQDRRDLLAFLNALTDGYRPATAR